jgi:hypothetical protein
MPMPVVLDIKLKAVVSKSENYLLSLAKNKVLDFQTHSTEEIESITLDPDRAFR